VIPEELDREFDLMAAAVRSNHSELGEAQADVYENCAFLIRKHLCQEPS